MPVMYMNTVEGTKYWADSYIDAGEHVRKLKLSAASCGESSILKRKKS